MRSYPAPERAVDTEGDCGGVPPTSFPYGPADGGVGEDRMLELTPIASSESTAGSRLYDIRYVERTIIIENTIYLIFFFTQSKSRDLSEK